MKRILLYSTALFILLFTACESEMDDRHFNPDGFTDAKIEYLYSKGASKTIENEYVDYYNQVFRLLGRYLQVIASRDGSGRTNVYTILNDKSRWENFYVTRMAELAEMDKIYNYKLTDDERKNYIPYMETAKVLKAYNTAFASDLFGAMPYTEAWGARNGIYGQPVNLKPKYDSQKDIYYAILSELETAANYLKTASLDSKIELHTIFKKQDIVFKGDLQKWYKFTNSLRLRYAMRISNVDEAKAKEVLGKLTLEDLITDNQDNAYTFLKETQNIGDGTGIWRAIKENHLKSQQYNMFAPELMTAILKEANDPRLTVFFQPATDDDGNVYDPDQEITPYPSSADAAITIRDELTPEEILMKYGVVNTVTFRKNYNLPYGVAITAADVWLLLAEARHRNLISFGSAEDFYYKGIIASVQEYYSYYRNSTETATQQEDIMKRDISEATLKEWLTGSSYLFNSAKALEQIATQKWMNMGILQPYENWSEYRRTDLPILVDDREKGTLLNKENAPVRFLYPANESSMNGENFSTVADQNYQDKRVWWDVK
jgi:hypothetical protein